MADTHAANKGGSNLFTMRFFKADSATERHDGLAAVWSACPGSAHQMMAPPSAPAATAAPSGDHRTQFTELSCPESVYRNRGVASPSLSTNHTCNYTQRARVGTQRMREVSPARAVERRGERRRCLP